MTKRKKKKKSYTPQNNASNTSAVAKEKNNSLLKKILSNPTFKATSILALVVCFAALLLSIVQAVTEPQIKKLAKEKEEKAIKQVLPGYTIESKSKTLSINNEKITYWEGIKEVTADSKNNNEKSKTSIKGYAFVVEKQGYSGIIKTMVGIDETYHIESISILSQSETPGLGDRCEEVASKFTFWDFISGKASDNTPQRPWFQQQFRGLDTMSPIIIQKKGTWNDTMRDELLKVNGITAITGATITSTTVRNSIQEGVMRFKNALTAKHSNAATDLEAQ